MIDIKHLVTHRDAYRRNMEKRQMDPEIVDRLVLAYEEWREAQQEFELCQVERNRKSSEVPNLSSDMRKTVVNQLKILSEKAKNARAIAAKKRKVVDDLLVKVPILADACVPTGVSEKDNKVLSVRGEEKNYKFVPKPYYELESVRNYLCQNEGVRVFGARGYYLRGKMAILQKSLFDFALEKIIGHAFEMIYPPLILNENTLTATGHLPDFDGQQYEVDLGGGKKGYLIGSAEPSLMAFFADSTLSNESLPIKVAALTSCFRKEAGSYGKDQRGIIRNHQFDKVEMVVICHPESSNDMLEYLRSIEREIYDSLGLRYREVEICSYDLPKKHCRQVDYEAFFPGQKKYIEIASNGNAGDYQTRALRIRIKTADKTLIAHSLNCTGITFRTGLALLEQNQQEDGSVLMPHVLISRLGFERI